jgi:hypothetical protein
MFSPGHQPFTDHLCGIKLARVDMYGFYFSASRTGGRGTFDDGIGSLSEDSADFVFAGDSGDVCF